MIVRMLATLIVAAGALQPPDAVAHPHSWIDLRTAVIFDEQGRITAFELDWRFDEFYSAFIVEEYLGEGQPPDEFLREIAQTNIVNLRDYDYFTVVRADGETVELGDVREYQTGYQGDRLWLRIKVPLVEPLDPTSSSITASVYDPTYYIEVLYVEDDPVELGPGAPDDCSKTIIPPTPDAEDISLAFSLDFTQRDTDGLGVNFAETLSIGCG